MFELNGRLALVTGGSRGLGAGIAEGLAESGADLIIVSRTEEEANKAANKIKEYGVKVQSYKCDVSKYEEVKELINYIEGEYGSLDIIINAAGINRRYPAEQFPLEEFKKVMETNVYGTYYVCREGFKLLKKSKSPSIINIGSLTVTEVTAPNICAYSASKGAIASMTKALAKEWGKYGIRVNAIAPGWYKTKMTEKVFQDIDNVTNMLKRVPLGRTGDPKDLKGIAVLLASDEGKYITGQVIFVDGGWTAN